jgi:hypothetical protein
MAPTIQDPSASSRSVYTLTRHASQPSRAAPPRRPSTIAELAERARDSRWDDSLSVKQALRAAHRYRNAGYAHIDNGDLEMGFVELARAATIVMEKIPAHKDYQTALSPTMRKNLGSVRFWATFHVRFSLTYGVPI